LVKQATQLGAFAAEVDHAVDDRAELRRTGRLGERARTDYGQIAHAGPV
jgi:hypothetical protein